MSATPTTEDHVFIERALARQPNGATALVAKYRRMLVAVLARCLKDREMAQDVAQETFFQAFRKLASLRDVGQFKNWLIKIGQRLSWAYKGQRGHTSLEDPGPATIASMADSNPAIRINDVLEQLLLAHQLRELVAQIPDPYRSTLVMRFYEDLTLADVAKRQGIQLPLAKYRVRHGLKLLRQKIEIAGITQGDL